MRSRVLDALVDATELDAPDKLVETEFGHRLEHFEQDLAGHGLTMDQYGAQAQLTELEIRKDIRDQVARAIKAELILEEVARGAEIQVTQEDIGQEIAMAAVRAGKDAKEVAEQVLNSGRLGTVAADIMRRKALDHVVQSVNVLNRHTEGA
jgi:trigger factor